MFKIKIILICLFIINMQNVLCSQTDSTKRELSKLKIKLDLTITIDSLSVEDTTYVLSVINYNNGQESLVKVSEHFVLYFDYNNVYEISIFRQNTNHKSIIIDTHAPSDEWYIVTSIALRSSENKDKIFVGSINYDSNTNTFVKKKPN